MPDPRGRRGRILPQQTMDPRTTIPGGDELRPPNPDACHAHDYPYKAECPTCYHNAKSDDDYLAMAEYLWESGL